MVAAYDEWRKARKAPGGFQAGRRFARGNFLHVPTLEAVGELRTQFGEILVEGDLVGGDAGGGRRRGREAEWLDDRTKAWNRYADEPAVVGCDCDGRRARVNCGLDACAARNESRREAFASVVKDRIFHID